MKIRLTCDVLVVPKHGMTKNRVLEVIEKGESEGRGRNNPVWVMGDSDEPVKIWQHEYEVVEE